MDGPCFVSGSHWDVRHRPKPMQTNAICGVITGQIPHTPVNPSPTPNSLLIPVVEPGRAGPGRALGLDLFAPSRKPYAVAMRCRAAKVRTTSPVVPRMSLASLFFFIGWGGSSSPSHAADRFDTAIFVCRSVDPTPTPLNLREKPFGKILGRLSPQSLLCVEGRDLRQPIRGEMCLNPFTWR
jgi:hypothetical protein